MYEKLHAILPQDELDDLNQEDKSLMDLILTESYTVDVIENWIAQMEKLDESSWDEFAVLSIFRSIKMLCHNLDLSLSSSTPSVLNHLYGTLCLARTIISRGGTVHLIEAISPSGRKLLRDLDLLYVERGVVFLCDYTQVHTDRIKVCVGEKFEDKYRKLNTIFPDFKLRRVVMSLPKSSLKFEITSSYHNSSLHEDDFCVSENIMNLVKDLTIEEAKGLIEDYADKIRHHNRRVVSHTHRAKDFLKRMEGAIIKAASENSMESAKAYESFVRDTLEYNLDYSHQTYVKYLLTDTKPLVSVPLIRRCPGKPNNSPYSRLKSILKSDPHLNPLGVLIILSEDGEIHPNESELSSLRSHPLWPMYEGIEVQRMKHKKTGELMDAVKVYFGGDVKSLNELAYGENNMDLRQIWKTQNSDPLSYSDLEKKFSSDAKIWLSQSTGSRHSEEMYSMSSHVMSNSEVGGLVRSIQRKIIKDFGESFLGSVISQCQEIALAMSLVPRKKLKCKSSSSSNKRKCVKLSLDTIGDRNGVLVTSMGSLLGEHKDQTYTVFGEFIDTPSCRPHSYSSVRWFNMSPPELDWHSVILHKAFSWISLMMEEKLSVNPDSTILTEQIVMPSLLMFVNSAKFAQASEMVRYLFVNSTGISSGTSPLWDKISWYSPGTYVEKLYMFRMMKMSNFCQFMKASGKKGELSVVTQSVMNEGDFVRHRYKFKNWNIAFPHESVAVLDDMHLYNSLYVCRSFTIQRYQKIMSESLVILKQLEAREKYLNTDFSDILDSQLLSCTNKIQLIDVLKSYPYPLNNGPYKPCKAVLLLGYLSSLILMKPKSRTVSKCNSECYKGLDSVMWRLSVSEVMNSRGSVTKGGASCVVVTNKIETKDKKTVSINQNDQCYHTLLVAYCDLLKNEPQSPLLDEVVSNYVKPQISEPDFLMLSTCPDLLWPLILYSSRMELQHVSKMVHKDQIGQREIAVLNACSRICCYYIESLARSIRDSEHMKELRTNLIERRDKDTIVESEYNKTRHLNLEKTHVAYDSADCSKWGPTVMSHTLYLSLGLRMPEGCHRNILRSCLSLFGNKVFKIPDAIYLYSKTVLDDVNPTNSVLKACLSIRNMQKNMGDYKRQLIHLPESMHQGILGVSSSVWGSDCQNLNCVVVKAIHNYNSKGFITSDDYVRIITTDSNDEEEDLDSLSLMIKRSLNVLLTVSHHFGITRNMEKSSHSGSILEFNSIFYTPNGVIKADVKSRVSYVDFGHSTDPYQNSLRCSTQSQEYFRQHSSLLGSCWVQLLNTHLTILQNQLRPLYSKVGQHIYDVPLELGGLPRINPLIAVCGPNFASFLNNYTPPGGQISDALSHMHHMEAKFGEMSLSEDEKSLKSVVPNISRSSVVHLCRRELRSKRGLRETVKSIPETLFTKIYIGKASKNMLLALMTCFQREKGEEGTESSSERFAVPQTPYEAKTFRLSNSILGLSGMVSRSDLTNLAVEWLSPENHSLSPLSYKSQEIPNFDARIDTELVMSMIKEAEESELKCHIKSLTPNNRHLHTERHKFLFTAPGFVSQCMQDFDINHKPKLLGGSANVKCQLYLESRELYQQKLLMLVERSQVFRMVLMDSDVGNLNFPQSLLVSSTFSNMRMVCNFDVTLHKVKVEDDMRFFPSLLSFKQNLSGVDISLTSPSFPRMIRERTVKRIDITDLVNASMRTNEKLAFNDSRSKSQIWALLSTLNLPLVVCPTQLKFPRIQERYNTLDGTHITNSYRLAEQDNPGSEVLVEKDKKYTHYHTIISKTDMVTELDGPSDVHKTSVLRNIKSLPVKISTYRGVLCLMSESHIIRALCSNQFDVKSKVVLKTRAALNPDLISRLCLNLPPQGLMPIDFELERPFEDNELKEEQNIFEVPQAESFLEIQESLLSDDDMSLNDSIYGSDLDEKSDDPSEDETDEEQERELDLGQFDYVGSEVSNQSSARATPNLGLIFAATSTRFLKTEGQYEVYEMKLPFLHPKSLYQDDEKLPALEQFVNDLYDNSPDSQWKVGFVTEVLKSSPAFSFERQRWFSRMRGI